MKSRRFCQAPRAARVWLVWLRAASRLLRALRAALWVSSDRLASGLPLPPPLLAFTSSQPVVLPAVVPSSRAMGCWLRLMRRMPGSTVVPWVMATAVPLAASLAELKSAARPALLAPKAWAALGPRVA